jgi:hypothetical protein
MVNLVGKNCPFYETSLNQNRKCMTDNEGHGVTPAAIISLVRGPRRIYALAAFAFGSVRPALATPAFALGASPPPAESRAAHRPSPWKAVNFEVIHCGKSETFQRFQSPRELKVPNSPEYFL